MNAKESVKWDDDEEDTECSYGASLSAQSGSTGIEWGVDVDFTLAELEIMAKRANIDLVNEHLFEPATKVVSYALPLTYNRPTALAQKYHPSLAKKEHQKAPKPRQMPVLSRKMSLTKKSHSGLGSQLQGLKPASSRKSKAVESTNGGKDSTPRLGRMEEEEEESSAMDASEESSKSSASRKKNAKKRKRKDGMDEDDDGDGDFDADERSEMPYESVKKPQKKKAAGLTLDQASGMTGSATASGSRSPLPTVTTSTARAPSIANATVSTAPQRSQAPLQLGLTVKKPTASSTAIISTSKLRAPTKTPRPTFRIYLSQFPLKRKNEITKKINELAEKEILSICISDTVRSSTHFVSYEDHKRPGTPVAINLLLAIVRGVWILEERWIDKLLEHSKVPKADKYEMTGLPGPRRARIARAARIEYLQGKGLTKDDGDDDNGDPSLPRLVFSDWTFNLDHWKGEPGSELLAIIITYGAGLIAQKFESDIWFTNANLLPEPVYSASDPIAHQDAEKLDSKPNLRKRAFSSSHTKRYMPTFALSLDWLRDSIVAYQAQDPLKYSNKIRKFNAL